MPPVPLGTGSFVAAGRLPPRACLCLWMCGSGGGSVLRIMERVLSAAWRWGALAGLYLVLAGETAIAELTAAILAGIAAAALSLGLRRATERVFVIRAPWRRLVLDILWSIARDVLRVGRAFVRVLTAGRTGTIIRQPFAQQPNDAAGAGHRALAVLLASLAPDGYVLAEDRGSLLIHRLSAAPPSRDRAWPT